MNDIANDPDGVFLTCRYCGHSQPLEMYRRTPKGRPMRLCIPCEAKRKAAALGKYKAYHTDYNAKAKARRAATKDKWMAFAMGDKQAVDWGEKR